jgi:hypothetical protein
MVQLLSLIVLKHNGQNKVPFLLASSFAVESFGFFQRSGVREACVFVTREVIQRSTAGQMLSVKHLNYMCHTRVTADGLAGIIYLFLITIFYYSRAAKYLLYQYLKKSTTLVFVYFP